ncbi:MAG: benzoyl-CoA 2,3-epoxidase subunit BoxB [Planctomycetes bacterium]|nr:benzoyl-CoA 2,3-epoxidase subunit BoxB [Planctomycetota bacterium]
MADVDRFSRIPNNVHLNDDKRLQRALEAWQPAYLEWWKEMGPAMAQEKDVYLRTATSVDADGWAHFDYVKMPEYRWGIFLAEQAGDRKIHFGDNIGQPVFNEVPGEYRNILRRIIVTQADTEPASVEQQRRLAFTAPSLLDMRNLFQVNVEEGRHLWAMVYLLHAFFGKDGREEADELLRRRSGDPDKPRILGAFNQPCNDWISFYAFTMFTDRDGKYQLASLAESGFDPLARTCRFMLTEEAHHLSVGETGLMRVVRRTAELMKANPGKDVRSLGGVDLATIQRVINFWYTYSLDLFGGEISSNSADFFAASLKGRYQEERRDEHTAMNQVKIVPVVENGRLTNKEVPLRNALNEVLRDDYVEDCERAVRRWNHELEKLGLEERLVLPSRRFHRHQGEYARNCFDPTGNLITPAEFEANRAKWLPSEADMAYLRSIMQPVHGIGQIAHWTSAPARGVDSKPFDFEYVRLG